MNEAVIATYVQTAVTLLVGTIAYLIYKIQKSDNKRDAANSLLLEIQSGENAISKVRDALNQDHLDVDVSVMPSESWSKNKHLFVRDFDKDEWESISDFYNKSSLLDQAISYNKTAFASDVEQIRTNKQRVLATYAEEAVKEATYSTETVNADQLQGTYDLKAKTFDKLYMNKQGEFSYTPQKPKNDAKLYLTDMTKLTTSSVGIKLKKIAKLDK